MTTLSPSGSSRRRSSALPVVFAVVAALAVGVAGGWWFAGRGHGTTTATPSTTSTCHSARSTASSSTGSKPPSSSTAATSTKKATGKPTRSPAGGALPLPRTITVNVYNATTRSGLALSTSLELAARGFHTAKVANDPAKKIIAASAEIRYGPKGALAAKIVAAQVIGAVLVPDHRADATVDFVLGEGYAALATPAQAKAAIAALATPSASPTEC
jgi:LytR cell envelope-related transcriptional attenuator